MSSPSLQNDLIYVEQWLQENKLVLNQSKTKWMLFGTRQKLEHSSDIEIQTLKGYQAFVTQGLCTSQIEASTSPLGIPRAFETFSCAGGRAFDHHSQRVASILCYEHRLPKLKIRGVCDSLRIQRIVWERKKKCVNNYLI